MNQYPANMGSNNPFRNPPPSYDTVGTSNNQVYSFGDNKSEQFPRDGTFQSPGGPPRGLPSWQQQEQQEQEQQPWFHDNPRYDPRFGSQQPGSRDVIISKNPLDPLPAQFARPPPPKYTYAMFKPMTCLGMSNKLQDGWTILPPPAPPGMQHPFVSHDVTEEDWTKFLRDLQSTSKKLTGMERLIGAPIISNLRISRRIQKRIKRLDIGVTSDFIDAWNNYFFYPRRMSVVLAQGRKRISGLIDDCPPDIGGHHQMSPSLSDSSSSGDESDRSSKSVHNHGHRHEQRHGHQHEHRYEHEHGHGYQTSGGLLSVLGSRRRARSESRWERRADRRERRAERRNARGGRDVPAEKLRLVICYFDGRSEVF